nr:PREDICTED: ejaculatory bulb-specific protein 3-like isoform X1 [Bemisia tabaci]
MKSVCVFAALVVACYAAPPAGVDEKLLSKYDNFDVDRVLNNDRVLANYIKCLMDEGSCTNEGRDLKKSIPDVLAGGCDKCTEKQKMVTEKVIKHLINKRPKDWDRLSKKYDPQGQYKNKYADLYEKVQKEAAKESKEPSKPTKDTTKVTKDTKESAKAPKA